MIRAERGENGTFEDLAFVGRRSFGFIHMLTVACRKSLSAEWNGEPAVLGVLGSSSGGHVAELLGMRPRDARYNAIPLAASPGVDASVAYVATRSPISDTHARYQQAEKTKIGRAHV